MEKKSNFEKVLLLIMALVALGVSGYLVYLGSGLPDRLAQKKVTPRNEMEAVPIAAVQHSTDLLKQVFNWSSPIKNNKPVPLNKSILLIMKEGQLYDLFVEQPQLRPPMTNSFLVKNGIKNVLSPNVGDLDQDGDGFANLEEFHRNTDPQDPKSQPPFTDHLYLKQRVADDYIIKLNSSIDPYQVLRLKPTRESALIAPPLPKPFGYRDPLTRQVNERFVAEKFEKKELDGKDVSELAVLDRATNNRFVLIRGEDKNLADYYAEFEFRHREVVPIKVKKGDNFRIPGVAETYQLLDIEETKAVISKLKGDGTEGEKIVIERR